MKAKTICLITAIFLVVCIAGATEIPPGPVSGDWYASGNPYNIRGEINIPTDSTLNIHEGVEVIFLGHFKFIVYGYMEAIGTEADSILFTAANTTVGWHGIRFLNAPDSSHLSYCIIQHGRATGPESDPDSWGGGIFCDSSNPVIAHSSIRSNFAQWYAGGIEVINSSSPVIDNCDIMGNSAYQNGGIDCYGSSSPIISSCNILNNTSQSATGGLNCSGSSSPTISDCDISGNSAGWSGGGLLIYTGSHPEVTNCTITGNSAGMNGGGVRISTDSNPNITGCTISGNTAADSSGGGISIAINCSPTITDCAIDSNSTGANGGGIYCEEFSGATIENCTISYNIAVDDGGGIRCFDNSNAIIENCTISYNAADSSGGGIASNNSSPQILDCMIMNNSSLCVLVAAIGGGGIACGYGGVPLISGCIITENTANSYAGGIGCYLADAMIEYCDISNNTGVLGGGLGIVACSPTLFGCTITDNMAANDGGGMELGQSGTSPIVENCTISRNEAPGYGSQIDVWYYASPDLINTVVEGNSANASIYFQYSTGTFSYCDFYNSVGANFSGALPTGLGVITGLNANNDPCDDFCNIFLDPLFYATGGDSAFYLTAESPCIDAGDPTSPLDPDSTIADIGAFYFDQLVWADNPGITNMPVEFRLYPAYPNPFNPTTTISFDLPVASLVDLKVFDIYGRNVGAGLKPARFTPGHHQITFDGSGLSSGIYIYRLTAGDFTASGKMVLMK